jgi:hypothetical protein
MEVRMRRTADSMVAAVSLEIVLE